MANNKTVNRFMEKKLYTSPLTEATNVKLTGVLLTSPEDPRPVPPIGPGPSSARRREQPF